MTKNNENKANLVSFFITELNVHASLAIWKQFEMFFRKQIPVYTLSFRSVSAQRVFV